LLTHESLATNISWCLTVNFGCSGSERNLVVLDSQSVAERPSAMPNIDYSSDDKNASSDEGNASLPTAMRPVTSPELEAEVREELAQLGSFVARHPCPCEEAVTRWLLASSLRAEQPGADIEDPRNRTLAWLLASQNWSPRAASCFHYPSFQQLWHAPQHERSLARKQQRRAGRELERRGGLKGMQLHYYMIHYAMTGEELLPGARKPMPVHGYANQLQKAWDGIGDWRA
jgi:hypothetical protein